MPESDDRNNWLRVLRNLDTWVTLIGGVLGIFIAFSFVLYSGRDIFKPKRDRELSEEFAIQSRNIERTQKQIARLREEYIKTSKQLRLLEAIVQSGQIPQDSSRLAVELSAAREKMDAIVSQTSRFEENFRGLDIRLLRIERAILDDPEKAVALPLLRRDVKALEQQTNRELDAIRAENGRVYDLMKWLVGFLALVSLSLIGTAVGNVFKREAAKDDAAKKVGGINRS
jgi:signal transduction histidine kinase